MKSIKPTRAGTVHQKNRREVTVKLRHSKHKVFAAAAAEIARRMNVIVTAEDVMAFLLEVEEDPKDLADLYCFGVLHWPVEWIEKPAR